MEIRPQANAETTPAGPVVAEDTLVPEKPTVSGTAASALIAAGIFLSRIAGLVRDSATAAFLGTSLYADAFRAGLRMPNVLQNLLGEGTLSASFIPVYSELIHEGKKEEAGRLAGATFSLLFAIAGAVGLVGYFLAPVLTDIFLFGFEGKQRELTITITRIIFPMTGFLVLSAWSLGVLNSHRQFFVPYFAPVFWNAAIIGALYLFGTRYQPDRLVIAVAWGALLGGLLQFAVQLPFVLRLNRIRPNLGFRAESFRTVVSNAGPAIMGRGVVQLSSWADVFLASLLVVGSVTVMTAALTLYMLPISLFGMSVAAAELPELARQRQADPAVIRDRARAGIERISFYVVPSVVAFLLLGDVVVGALYQRGQFTATDTLWVWITLSGFAIGLLATTTSRLFSSTYFALRDTRTPARIATVRVVLTVVLGVALMLAFEGVRVQKWGLDLTVPAGPLGWVRVGGKPLGVFGLALGAGIAGWVEWWMLRSNLKGRIGSVGARAGVLVRMFAAALAGAAAAWALRWVVPVEGIDPALRAIPILGAFGVVYLGLASVFGLEETAVFTRRLKRVVRRG
jgi:putative peptidoglycan lipid II flippase